MKKLLLLLATPLAVSIPLTIFTLGWRLAQKWPVYVPGDIEGFIGCYLMVLALGSLLFMLTSEWLNHLIKWYYDK